MSIGISARVGVGGYRFYTGGAAAAVEDVPFPFPVAIGGHPYMIDTARYSRATTDVLRQAYDQTGDVGEQSLSIEGYWKRFQEDWRDGAGQKFYDAQSSSRARYWVSKGIDPWVKPGQACLLNDVLSKRLSTTATNPFVVVAESASVPYLYTTDGAATYRTTDPDALFPTWALVTSAATTAITSVTHDGSKVWLAHGTGGVYELTGAGATTQLSTAAMSLVAYSNGFLFGTHNNVAYTISAGGTATALTAGTMFNTAGFTFTCIAGSPNAVFFGGNAGDFGQMFAVTIDETSGAPATMVPAGRLPDGEKIFALASYGGLMLVGTSRGVRAAQVTDTTGVAIGPLIDIGKAVRAFEPQGDEVWFGWSNYDGVSTGLGRLKLSRFTDTLVPAYSSDLMAGNLETGVQGNVTSIATFNNLRFFGVAGVGLYGEYEQKIATGYVDSGWISYSTPEDKIAGSLDIRHEPLHGSVTLAIIDPDETVHNVGTSSSAGSLGPPSVFSARGRSAEHIRIKMTLNRDGTDPTEGPCVYRWLLRSIVAPEQTEQFSVPIQLFERVSPMPDDGTYYPVDTLGEYRFLKGLEASRRPVIYQEGHTQHLVTVRNVGIPEQGVRGWNSDRSWFNTVVIVRMVSLIQGSG